jgi:hypothetical protein
MYKKITIVLFMMITVGLTLVSFIVMPKEEQPFSENENRYLTKMPDMNLTSISNKSFMGNFSSWFSDRFVWREDWITFKNQSEIALGKKEVNGIFITENQMIQAWRDYDLTQTQRLINSINNFTERHNDIPVYVMLIPTAQEIYQDTLPQYAVVENQKNYIKTVYDSLSNITTIDAYSLLSSNKHDYLYYRTDHHWTSTGAFLGYHAASSVLGYTPIESRNFITENASSEFYGTLFSKTLDKSIPADVIKFYKLKENEPEVTVSVMNVNTGGYTEYESLYFREYLDKKDKYSVFLGTNSPIIHIKSNVEKGRSLLIFKDSYAHAMIPFLTKHYDMITMVDMRYINVNYETLVDIENYDQVLFLFNVITFSNDDTGLVKLNMANS